MSCSERIRQLEEEQDSIIKSFSIEDQVKISQIINIECKISMALLLITMSNNK